MPTERLPVRSGDPAPIERAAAALRAGGLVAFPTETVYGLGANALDAAAVAGIFRAKGRDLSDPCIVHIADWAGLDRVVAARPPSLAVLASAFWPGPLSLILPKAASIPPIVTAGRDTVAVRLPDHPVALALIRAAGVPIAAPSANRFMHTSPTTAQHVWDDLQGRIDLILDGGPTPIGVESTVLDLTATVPTVLRPGGVSVERLRAVLGTVQGGGAQLVEANGGARSPGLLTTHYAPEATLTLYAGTQAAALAAIEREARRLLAEGRAVGLLLTDEDSALLRSLGASIASLGPRDDAGAQAALLYAALRALEGAGVERILARDVVAEGLGLAVRDRLRRAAGGVVVVAVETE